MGYRTRVSSSLVGLCYPSNLLLEYSRRISKVFNKIIPHRQGMLPFSTTGIASDIFLVQA